jgi:energy-coupling factor transporter ATP-binding protein EcfA2
VTAVIETEELGKQYRERWALAGCTLSIPVGHVVGLVGPNGAGKTTLLNLATGELAPSAGTIEVLGNRPAAGCASEPGLGCGHGTPAGRAAGPGPEAEGRDAVRRAARPARADPGRRPPSP